MNIFKNTGLALGATFLVATASFGQQRDRQERKEPPTFAELLEKMDANEDGKLSKKEVKGPLKEHFDEVDKDEDGFITEEELKNAPRPKGRRKE